MIYQKYSVIDNLYHYTKTKNEDITKSYTANFNGSKLYGKKIVEEALESFVLIKDKNEDEAIYEATDITYHVLVALTSLNINPDK